MFHAGILHWMFPGLLGCLSTTDWLWMFAAQINLGIGQLSGECVCIGNRVKVVYILPYSRKFRVFRG